MKSNMHEEEKVEKVRNYVEGKLRDIEGEPIYEVYNPAFGKVIARTAGSGQKVVDAVVDNAMAAFRNWSMVPVTDRVKILFRLENLLRENADEIARIVTTEHGKTFDESYGEVMRAVENVESATAATYHIMGRNNSDIARGIDEELIREPIGVFAVIAPFNFPVMVPFWFIPYAIGLGNTVVVKPSEKVPLTMQFVSSMFEKAGIPPGVVSIVNGGQETVEALLSNRYISGYSFVGSTRTAEIIHRRGTESHRRVQAGASAKNYELVMPDADLGTVIPSLISSFFGNAGERCLAGSVLVTLPQNHEKVVKAFAEAASRLRLGFGLDADTDMGPLIREDHLKRVESYINKGVEEGAQLILDGRKKRSQKHPEGYFLGPTIFDNATLNYLKDSSLLDTVRTNGVHILKRLEEFAQKNRYVGEVRGRGYMIAMEMVDDPATKKPGTRRAARIKEYMFRHGVLMHTCGHYSNVLRFMAPLTIEPDLADRGIDILGEALKEVT